jgi:hypothetical protein
VSRLSSVFVVVVVCSCRRVDLVGVEEEEVDEYSMYEERYLSITRTPLTSLLLKPTTTTTESLRHALILVGLGFAGTGAGRPSPNLRLLRPTESLTMSSFSYSSQSDNRARGCLHVHIPIPTYICLWNIYVRRRR